MTAGSATTPRPSFALTAMVKSSRQMLCSILALEEPHIRVLNYDPGAVDTESLRSIRDSSHDSEIRAWIQGFYDRNEVLTAETVVNKLYSILNTDEFKSGTYINAYE